MSSAQSRLQNFRQANKFVAVSATVTTEQAIWSPATGSKFRWLGMYLQSSSAGVMTFKDQVSVGGGGPTIGTLPFAANVPVWLDYGMIGKLSSAANNKLTVTGPSAAVLTGEVYGVEEDDTNATF